MTTIPHLAPLTEAGDFLFLSGQLPFNRDRAIASSGIEEQTTQVMENITGVLAGAGLTLADVVKATVWLKRASDFVGFNESYARAFGHHKPARSTVVSDLMVPAALVEIEVIARRRGKIA